MAHMLLIFRIGILTLTALADLLRKAWSHSLVARLGSLLWRYLLVFLIQGSAGRIADAIPPRPDEFLPAGSCCAVPRRRGCVSLSGRDPGVLPA